MESDCLPSFVLPGTDGLSLSVEHDEHGIASVYLTTAAGVTVAHAGGYAVGFEFHEATDGTLWLAASRGAARLGPLDPASIEPLARLLNIPHVTA